MVQGTPLYGAAVIFIPFPLDGQLGWSYVLSRTTVCCSDSPCPLDFAYKCNCT